MGILAASLSLRTRLLLAGVLVQVLMLALLIVNGISIMDAKLNERTRIHLEEEKQLLGTALLMPLASGQYGFDPTTRDYVIFLGLRNETTVAVDVRYGLCTIVVAGFATPSLSGPRLWSRLLPQLNGCGPDIGLILRVNPQSTEYITVGTVPGNVLDLSDYVGLIVKIAGETSLRGVSLVESVVNAGATPSP